MNTFWETIAALVAWLDRESQLPDREARMARVMKVGEELGEVHEAVLGALGLNPRKGVTNGWEKVSAELVDVLISTAVALWRIEGEQARATFEEHFARVAQRSLALAESGSTDA